MPLEELRSGDPQQLGPYRLLGRLGGGGMGRVFLGRSPGGRLVAVKVIRVELAGSADFRERFAREVAAARKVGGSFTAPVVDASMDDPVPWLATAYVRGPSLEEAVARHGPLDAESVLALAAGLAEGLGAIHAAGVVHRDLKPSNVLLAEDGPRVIDFGISRAGEATALTRTGLVIGSPGFMSPEQAEGREVGPASDVFSLGAVLVFAATGEGPFGSGSTAAMVYRIVYGQPQTSQLPPEIRSLAERCLAKDPQERPATGQILVELAAIRPPSADLTTLQAALTFRGATQPAVPPAFTPGAAVGAGGADTPDPPGLPAAPDPEPDDHPAGAVPGEQGPAWLGLPQAERIPPEGPATLTSVTVVQGTPGSVRRASGVGAQESSDTSAGQGAPVSPEPGGSALPITVPGAGPRAGRGRRRWAVAVIAAAAALGVITGLVIWAPWVSPPVLRPTGLTAYPSTVSSVTFSWSSPATGPVPDRYVIFQDGTMTGSVPGTITSYQGKGLAPDTAYQYQVEAVRGGQHSPRSPAITVSTLTPPVSAAILSGPWTVHYKVVAVVPPGSDSTYTLGKTWTDNWVFTPDCTVGSCAVTLHGGISGPGNLESSPIPPTLLARSGAVYSGTTTMDDLEDCDNSDRYPVHETVRFRIIVSGASVADKQWEANSWAGTMEVDSSYTSAGAKHCPASSWSTTLHGIP